MEGEDIKGEYCWSDEELSKKEAMVSFIKQTTQNEINKWWEEQTIRKSNNEKYIIEPFYIWRKKT